MRTAYFLLFMAIYALTASCGSSNFTEEKPLTRQSNASSSLDDSNARPPKLNSFSDHGNGYGWQNDKCFVCHTSFELKDIHSYSPDLSTALSKLDQSGTGVCLYCHGANGLPQVTADDYQCLLCHSDDTIADTQNMFTGYNIHDMNSNGELDNADCVVCHSFSDMNGELDLAVDFTQGASAYADKTAFCLNCHDGNGAFGITPPLLSLEPEVTNLYSTYMGIGEVSTEQKLTADIHGVQNGSGQNFGQFRGSYQNSTEVPCLACHQAHSSDNPYMVTQGGASAELADNTAQTAAVAVTENDFSQLCALCHQSVGGAPTDNGLTEVLHPSTFSTYCTDCHYHGAGFDAQRSGFF